MFQDILIPLDGSSRAERVLPVAARLAQVTAGTVSLFQAVWPPSVYMASVGEVVLPDLLDETVPAAKMYLENVAKKSSLEGVRTETQVVIGHPAEAIITTVNAVNTDLVVICSHGYTGQMRWAMGSIAEKVARHVSSPVFILYEDCSLLTEKVAIPHGSVRILVPLDGSKHAESTIKAAMLATALSAPARGELHLTRVVSPRGREMSSIDEELERTGLYLRAVIERMQHHGPGDESVPLDLDLTWSITMADDVASGIMQAAEGSDKGEVATSCQAIAMTAHGRSDKQLWSLGSTTERVLQAARKPLLIVH